MKSGNQLNRINFKQKIINYLSGFKKEIKFISIFSLILFSILALSTINAYSSISYYLFVLFLSLITSTLYTLSFSNEYKSKLALRLLIVVSIVYFVVFILSYGISFSNYPVLEDILFIPFALFLVAGYSLIFVDLFLNDLTKIEKLKDLIFVKLQNFYYFVSDLSLGGKYRARLRKKNS